MALRRSLLCVGVALGLFLAVHLLVAATGALAEKNDFSAAVRKLVTEWHRNEEIASASQRLAVKRSVQAEVAEDVVAGRLSMAEGIDRFRALYPNGPDSMMVGDSDDEKFGRCLLRWTENEAYVSPANSASRRGELEAELARHLAGQTAT